MGYVGQHLVSIVTGYPGGRSGARGDDLKLPGGAVGEIKCCYRVDQLGACIDCGTAVAATETICPNDTCRSGNLKRRDDSKWLLSPKSEGELRGLFVPAKYFFVLFEFADMADANDINVSIYEVDPRNLGFSLCVIDYFFNIRSKSRSGAPFNLWPHSPKFLMMKPKLIYRSIIKASDEIETVVFPGAGPARLERLRNLTEYASSDTFDESAIDAFAKIRRVLFARDERAGSSRERKRKKLERLERERRSNRWADAALADDLARAVYMAKVSGRRAWLRAFAPEV
jgi:hypothetical protein